MDPENLHDDLMWGFDYSRNFEEVLLRRARAQQTIPDSRGVPDIYSPQTDISQCNFKDCSSPRSYHYYGSHANKMSQQNGNEAPSGAKDAVLVKSDQMPEGAQQVEDFDFDRFKAPVTAVDLLEGMRHMGFQASSIGEAVRIINGMV
jgi:hypothetical protein